MTDLQVRIGIVLLGMCLWSANAWGQSGDWRLSGAVAGRSTDADSSATWLRGGEGKLASGEDAGATAFGRLHLALDYEPSLYFRIHAHGVARYDDDVHEGEAFGLTEAYAQVNTFFGGSHRLRFSLGMMFPPTSLENVREPWQSPYTLHVSALNSWLAHELRPTGLDVSYSRELLDGPVLFAGLGSVSGSDSAGALLAWRGFAFGDRLSVLGELLPLPELFSLSEAGSFAVQRDDGSKPMGRDLDGELGFQWRTGMEWAAFFLQVTAFDNRGDRGLHRGEYAWRTRFHQVGMEWRPGTRWNLVAEWMSGETGMGDPTQSHVQMDFQTWYLLASYHWRVWRVSARYDDFQTDDLDAARLPFNTDLNEESGDALTLTAMLDVFENWRLALEWIDVRAERPLETGAIEPGGSAWMLELRYLF